MERNQHKDILDTMEIYAYLAEIMRIPLGRPSERYNGEESGERDHACTIAREFGSYRSLCLRENSVRRRIERMLAECIIAEKTMSPQLPILRSALRRTTLELAELALRRRRIEERRDSLKGELVKMVVQHRYFDDLNRRMPTWSGTARELGIALSGEELRGYICKNFEEMR